jgi:hypothetical protein
MDDVLILGLVGIGGYMLYQYSQSKAASAIAQAGSATSEAVANIASDYTTGVKFASSGFATDCINASGAAQLPLGVGVWSYPDSYVIPCAGGATVGMLRQAGYSDTDLMNAIATAACACAGGQAEGLSYSATANTLQGWWWEE